MSKDWKKTGHFISVVLYYRKRQVQGGEKMSDSRFKPGDTRINYAGGPTKEKQVKEWYKSHPGGSVSACARELDISRPTARKWKPTEQAESTKKPGKLSRILNILKE